MSNLQFVKRIHNGRNCYSDSLSTEEIMKLHIQSGVENIVSDMIDQKRIIFITGNPGDGKTYIIRSLEDRLISQGIYVESDLNSISDTELNFVAKKIIECYQNGEGCVIAANEFPFFKLVQVIKKFSLQLYNEIMRIKKNVLMYGCPSIMLQRVCVIDLNERNLLDKDRSIVKPVINKFVTLLKESKGSNIALDYNIKALSNEHIISQLLQLFNQLAASGKHFAVRDILGSISYSLTACTNTDEDSLYYYDAIFMGNNELMNALNEFDPVLLTHPKIDEEIWNGEKNDGWLITSPTKWPKDITEESIEDAMNLFKSIKRKFYFENIFAKELIELKSSRYSECEKIFFTITDLSQKKRTRAMLISSMNKIFLSTDTEKEKLRIWTTLSYDLSRESKAAISSKYIDASDLEIEYPQPIAWLKDMEFAPNHLIMKLKNSAYPRLEMDVNLLMGLISIKNGYPSSLLSGQYEMKISLFLQELLTTNMVREYGDGEFLLANRKEGVYKKISIEGNKYCFSDKGDY